MTDNFHWGFLMARLAAGMSMFGHGLVRLPKLSGFSNWMVGQFQKSMLPETIVIPFSYILPVAELVIGFLLLLGLFTRTTLIAAGFVMTALIFGSSMIEEWGAIPSQLLHAAFFAILLCYTNEYNRFSLDQKFQK
ncbi:DoxX family membrane protein [Dyadobacter flavalbus]|uniref:DoxX family membrane protein n=1 Tax=Dyadobacter flavalbus TaxID=2579942 RepID=A0A5M8QV52_9BACT|nr:DoxX family membrane protein [Dyadobacter flavalbus]KAA6439178.1 DoxX family membrane protein [Dyadobacter flavalbus]